MDRIAAKLKAYIDTYPLDLGEGDCETVLDQLYQAYAESHESDPLEIRESFKELDELLVRCRWMIIMRCSTFAVVFVLLTNAKHFQMAYYTVLI